MTMIERVIYRVGYSNFADSDCGAEFFTARQAAEHAAAAWLKQYADDEFAKATIEEIKIELTKDGILRLLNRYAGHPNNG
jgi:hypothetical protein